jgi:hypothetical protein
MPQRRASALRAPQIFLENVSHSDVVLRIIIAEEEGYEAELRRTTLAIQGR